MGPVLNAGRQKTGKQIYKTEQKRAKFKNTFPFLKTIIFTEIPKCSFISPLEAIETSHYPMLNRAKIQSQSDLQLSL